MKRWLRLLGPFLGILFVGGLFAVLAPDTFLTPYNLRTVATQAVLVALGAMGMTFVVVSGGIDLSVGSIVAFSAVLSATIVKAGLPPWLALGIGSLAGALVGACNGLLVIGLRVVPFLVTLGTMGILRGAAKWLGNETKVDADPGWLASIMTKFPEPQWLQVSLGVWIMLALALLLGIVLHRSVFGVRCFAVGSNEANARLCGVPVERTKVSVYALCGALAGLAGVLHFARLTQGDPTAALGYELEVIAAVVIGGGSLAGGEGTVLGSLLGALLMAILANGCDLIDVSNYVQEMIVGAVIVVAVALDRYRSR